MVSSVVVERVNLGLSPMKETKKAAVHILFKMDYQSAMVFSSSRGRQDVKEPAVSSIFVPHTTDHGLRSGILGRNCS